MGASLLVNVSGLKLRIFEVISVMENSRVKALIDCLWKLPRPAIFYTTEVKAANELNSIFRGQWVFRELVVLQAKQVQMKDIVFLRIGGATTSI